MNMKILAGLLLLNTNVYAEQDNSSIYEEAILPSFAESSYYQAPQVSIDFELDIMMDSSRFGAELKFSQAIGSYFSVTESVSYYSADTAVIDNDKQYIAGAGALFTPLKERLLSPFLQFDLGYLGWVSEQSKWTTRHCRPSSRCEAKSNKIFWPTRAKMRHIFTRDAPDMLQGDYSKRRRSVLTTCLLFTTSQSKKDLEDPFFINLDFNFCNS